MKILKIGKLEEETKIIYLGSIAEVRKFVENFGQSKSFMSEQQLVIGNLSKLTREASAVLLKFIEEGIDSITCFASEDNINPVLMSRFDKVEKVDNIKAGFGDFIDFVRSQKEKQGQTRDINKEFTGRSAHNLDKFLFWKRMDVGVRHRMEDLL